MQGDIITRIREWKDYIGHYHTAGVPGRNELDDNQEINYPPIMREIVKTGYQGYVAQEFIPTRDPLGGRCRSLRGFRGGIEIPGARVGRRSDGPRCPDRVVFEVN